MLKIVLAVSAATALLTTAPLVTPAKAEGVKMAQGVDVQIGRDRDATIETVATTARPQSASAPVGSLSARENAAAW